MSDKSGSFVGQNSKYFDNTELEIPNKVEESKKNTKPSGFNATDIENTLDALSADVSKFRKKQSKSKNK